MIGTMSGHSRACPPEPHPHSHWCAGDCPGCEALAGTGPAITAETGRPIESFAEPERGAEAYLPARGPVGTCLTVVAYLPDGRTPVLCMLRSHTEGDHVAHVRQPQR